MAPDTPVTPCIQIIEIDDDYTVPAGAISAPYFMLEDDTPFSLQDGAFLVLD